MFTIPITQLQLPINYQWYFGVYTRLVIVYKKNDYALSAQVDPCVSESHHKFCKMLQAFAEFPMVLLSDCSHGIDLVYLFNNVKTFEGVTTSSLKYKGTCTTQFSDGSLLDNLRLFYQFLTYRKRERDSNCQHQY